MVVEISQKTEKAVLDMIKVYGYKSVREFVEDALRRRILDLKKADFLKKTAKIRQGLAKRGLTEEDILEDFDKLYHQK